ncbi:MAG: long-chain fatty acid--CoA ligase [Acidobacteria bacterium]|nr:long-chain fatty acid--CoA ligase [Acidobacteriota bacterium]
MAPQTLVDLFDEAVTHKSRPDALLVKREDGYQPLSSAEVRSQVEGLVAGLMNLGVETGDRIALLSENRPEWLVSDLAILSVGAINVPVYPTLPSNQIEGLLNDAGVKIIILSTSEQLEKIREIQSKIPSLQVTVVMDLEEPESDSLRSFDSLREEGEQAWQSDPAAYQKVRQGIGPQDVATIIYTSGTTGPPKGVMLSHANIVANVLELSRVFDFDPKDSVLSLLPLSHIFERVAHYLMFYCGVSIAYAESIEKVPVNMQEVHPTVVACVPRFFEKLYDRVMESRQLSSGLKRILGEWAFGVGERHTRHILQGTSPSPGLAFQRFLASKLVFAKLQQRIGGRLRFFISGGAPLDPSLAEFFLSAGILVLEGYGLTETSPVIAVNVPNCFRFGTVGQPLPGLEVRIAEDGEVLTRGPSVMLGYYNRPEETREVIKDGWFHTGDIGHLDSDGFLKITDRKKDLIVTAGGKNVAPQPLERLLKASPALLNAVVLGDRRPYLCALVVPNPDTINDHAREQGLSFGNYGELLQSPQIREFLMKAVEKSTAGLASFETVKKVIPVEKDFTIEDGELTPTLKVKRRVVEKRFKSEIEALYAESPSKPE